MLRKKDNYIFKKERDIKGKKNFTWKAQEVKKYCKKATWYTV